ncbi:hypothetical protein K6U37_12005, partial [Vibrio parahaemolyticus]|uniref:hypothetical protein n=1 Tax=Vibrio parahaemolyticus TaxID=670 RepID=UPI001EEB1C12
LRYCVVHPLAGRYTNKVSMKIYFCVLLFFCFPLQASEITKSELSRKLDGIETRLVKNGNMLNKYDIKSSELIEHSLAVAQSIETLSLESTGKMEDLDMRISKVASDLESMNSRLSSLDEVTTEQNKKTNKYIKSAEELNWYRDFFMPIMLSLIAAVFFWFVFSFVPDRTRKNKIRIKVKHNFKNLESELFFLFNEILYYNGRHVHGNQQQIRSGKLTEEVLYKYLSFKCLSNRYLLDRIAKELFSDISGSLRARKEKAITIVDELFLLLDYLSADEILMLENIKTKLNVYSFSDSGSLWVPVNPSINYMAGNLMELYESYYDLLCIVNRKNSSWESAIIDIQSFYYQGLWSDCYKRVKRAKKSYSDRINFLDWYEFLCLYKKQDDRAKILFTDIVKRHENLVHSRSFLIEILDDEIYMTILQGSYTDTEIKQLKDAVASEDYGLEIEEKFEQARDYKLKDSFLC